MSNRNKRMLIYQVTGTRRFTAKLLTIAFCGAPQMSISNGRDNELELHVHNEGRCSPISMKYESTTVHNGIDASHKHKT